MTEAHASPIVPCWGTILNGVEEIPRLDQSFVDLVLWIGSCKKKE